MNLFLHPTFIISILIAISIHEWAHGFTAYLLGDPTAKQEGRLTVNPIAHLDLLGTLMFLIVGFGWAKPVPINPSYFAHPKRDSALVALAGPLSNLILASMAFVCIALIAPSELTGNITGLLSMQNGLPVWQLFVIQVCGSSIFINLALMAFNLLPIAPLDGSKILQMFIPYRYEEAYFSFMQRGPMVLLVLILAGMFLNIPILSAWVFGIVNPVLAGMEGIASAVGLL